MGPRNLRAKRITALWRDRLEDFSPLSALQPSNRKRKTKANVKANCDGVKPDIEKVGCHGGKASQSPHSEEAQTGKGH